MRMCLAAAAAQAASFARPGGTKPDLGGRHQCFTCCTQSFRWEFSFHLAANWVCSTPPCCCRACVPALYGERQMCHRMDRSALTHQFCCTRAGNGSGDAQQAAAAEFSADWALQCALWAWRPGSRPCHLYTSEQVRLPEVVADGLPLKRWNRASQHKPKLLGDAPTSESRADLRRSFRHHLATFLTRCQ